MDAISAKEATTKPKPIMQMKYPQMSPAVPPLPNAKTAVDKIASHVDKMTMQKPSMVTDRKFRCVTCFFPIRIMSFTSAVVPSLSRIKVSGSPIGERVG